MFYVLHGEDEFSRSQELSGLRGQLAGGDPAMADLNTSIFDGARLTLGELRHACDAIPFLADRRVVLVHGLLSRLASGRRGKPADGDDAPAWKKEFLKDLAAYLPHLPDSTRLFFIEEKSLMASHQILKLAKSLGQEKGAVVKHYAVPKDGALPGWIRRRVADRSGQISTEAVTLLAALVGADLRLLDQEIEKLLLYADGQQISSDHVRALVSRARETSIFDLVDCVGRRETDQALRLLHRMLEEEAAPLYLLAMLARQVRILIQVKELSVQRLSDHEIAGRIKLHPYVVKKGVAQAQRFSLDQLETAHQLVLEADWAIKTGRMEDVLALDMLVVNLTRR